MAFGERFFSRFFKNQEDFFMDMELDEEHEEDFEWDWEHIVEERHLFKMSDDVQREKYIRNLVEQIKEASTELDKLSNEYNLVTATLKDMDEIEALPFSEKVELQDAAGKVLHYEGETRDYSTKKAGMTEEQYRAMERFEDQMPEAYNKLKEAEEYKVIVRDDLKKLEGEKHAFLYRQSELRTDIQNAKGMVIVCVFATILCILMLLVLQFGFEMETGIGYTIVVLCAAVSITFIYVKYLDATREMTRTSKGINRLILLQNTVKIRYVNNSKLLDYLYTKYKVNSSKELETLWEAYQVEKEARDKNELNARELSHYQSEYLKRLRKYQLNDVYAWLHNPLAIIEHNEMVEIRHAHIIQRQKLRARMDYNKRLAKEGEKELREFIKQYPEYSGEAIAMLDRYS